MFPAICALAKCNLGFITSKTNNGGIAFGDDTPSAMFTVYNYDDLAPNNVTINVTDVANSESDFTSPGYKVVDSSHPW